MKYRRVAPPASMDTWHIKLLHIEVQQKGDREVISQMAAAISKLQTQVSMLQRDLLATENRHHAARRREQADDGVPARGEQGRDPGRS